MDIDPSFSLGELEREKQETLSRLTAEGIFNQNKLLKLPLIPQRIAIISVQTSKGYADFLKVINDNPWKYKFFHLLFPSLLQGDHAAESIRYQLGRIQKVIDHFDVVAIVRGGGGDVGLSCFNDFQLSQQVAKFPIPVITGIGHATNETVVEMIAHKNAITPTDLANYLIEKFNSFNFPLRAAEEKLVEKSQRIIRDQRTAFLNTARYFRSVTEHILIDSGHEINHTQRALLQHAHVAVEKAKEANTSMVHRIRTKTISYCVAQQHHMQRFMMSLQKDVKSVFDRRRHDLERAEGNVRMLSPVNVLKRGYSITMVNGKAVTSFRQVSEKDIITNLLADGEIVSQVSEIKNSNQDE
jgi:exodeoxyribonuclease VII large subunit